jgi:hypothetical protein
MAYKMELFYVGQDINKLVQPPKNLNIVINIIM